MEIQQQKSLKILVCENFIRAHFMLLVSHVTLFYSIVTTSFHRFMTTLVFTIVVTLTRWTEIKTFFFETWKLNWYFHKILFRLDMSRYLNKVTRQFDNFLMTLLFILNILIACTWGEIKFSLFDYLRCWITCWGCFCTVGVVFKATMIVCMKNDQ